MAANIFDWSTTPGDNDVADTAINWTEGQMPSTVNNSARQMMARIAEFIADIGGSVATAGTANARTLTLNSAFTNLVNGRLIAFRSNVANTGSTTLNVNGAGARQIRMMTTTGDVALAASDLTANGVYLAQYSSTANAGAGAWVLVGASTINASRLTTGTLPSGRISGPYTGLTGTGALDAGSITSGFGNIDIGASTITTTGALSVGGTTVGGNLSLSNPAGRLRQLNAGASLILAANEGAIILRPLDGSGEGQFIVNSLGNVTAAGSVTATSFSGDGASLTALNASNLASGTVPDARFPATLPAVSGANLTALNASNLASGTVPDARFPATLPASSGANLTTLNASNISSGTIADARLPTTQTAKTFSSIAGNNGGSNLILGTTGAGTVNLRPNGTGSSSGQMQIQSSGNVTVGGDITASGDITANSDIRLKEKIDPIKDALAKINALSGITFQRKADSSGQRSIGFVAQDVQLAVPEIVRTDSEGYLALSYGNLTALLVEAIKELDRKIEALS